MRKRSRKDVNASSRLWGPRFLVVFLSFLVITCSKPPVDCDSDRGRSAVMDEVNILLTIGKCDEAIDIINLCYHSERTNNEIRLLRSAAYGCKAQVNFFDLVDEIVTANKAVVGWLWLLTAQYFNANSIAVANRNAELDSRVVATWEATDSLFAALKPGRAIPASKKVNAGTRNEGSIVPYDRIDDANVNLLMIALAGIGAIQNRYGAPNSTGNQTTAFSWTLRDDVIASEEACGFGAAVANLTDAIDVAVANSSGSIQTALTTVQTLLGTEVDTACSRGCQGQDPLGAPLEPAACPFTCATDCVDLLRGRANCASDNRTACAAAGIVRYFNSATGWP